MKLVTLEEPDGSWDQFVETRSDLIFHTSLWGKVLKEGYGCKLRYFVLEDEGEWLLAIPGMLTGRFLKLWYSLIPYGGFIGKREYIPVLLDFIIKDIRRYKIDRLQIVDPYLKGQAELPGFQAIESVRHVLDLSDKTEEGLWKSYKPNLRWSIKTALKRGLFNEKIKDISQVKIFYELYQSSMERNKAVIKYPIRLFESIYSLMPEGQRDILFVKSKDKTVAGIFIIYSNKIAHDFHNDSLTRYLSLRPNDLLIHQSLRLALNQRKEKFDFLGSSKSMMSLIQFKDKWGAERKPLLSLHQDIHRIKAWMHKFGTPLLRLSQRR